MREPQLGVCVGKRGIGKTFRTLDEIRKYVTGYGGKSKPRRVLIMDVNDEFTEFKALSVSDVKKFSMHPKVEVRRIRPYNPDGTKMTLKDVCMTLFAILDDFKGGLLLIEDINKYLSHNLPKDVVGAICTNRHNDMDIILHYQAIGKVPVTVWENANWIRFHKNNQSVDRHEKKFEDRFELVKIAETMVNTQYELGNDRFYLYVNLDHDKIMGEITPAMQKLALNDYLSENYNRIIKPELNKRSLSTGEPIFKDQKTAVSAIQTRMLKQYF